MSFCAYVSWEGQTMGLSKGQPFIAQPCSAAGPPPFTLGVPSECLSPDQRLRPAVRPRRLLGSFWVCVYFQEGFLVA